jgi:ribokinase
MPDVVVVGQIARDLVLGVDTMPAGGGSTEVRHRAELLGGKGANQAVGLRQLTVTAGLVGVVGDDAAGADVLRQAGEDGIDVEGVVRRSGATTALLVDVVEEGGVRRLLEHVPAEVLLRPDDVRGAELLLRSARMVLVQLQQPGPAVMAALDVARDAGVPVMTDGAPADDRTRDAVLAGAAVIRADDSEAGQLLGEAPSDVDAAVEAARALLEHGPVVVALASGSQADVVAWRGGHVVMPLLGSQPVDPTGAGDAFVAALATAILRGDEPEHAAWLASAAAAATVGHLGGRPRLDLGRLEPAARRARTDHAGGRGG